MALVTTIPELVFSRNFPVLTVGASAATTVLLEMGTDTVLSEIYYPDDDDQFTIDLADLLTSLLTVAIPASLPAYQDTAAVDFTLTLTEGEEEPEEHEFKVLKGGVNDGVSDMSAFLMANMLTWRPQVKRVKLDDPEYIDFYAEEACLVWAKAWFLTNPVITIGTLMGGKHHVIDATFSRLRSLFLPFYLPRWIDVWIEDRNSNKTWTQRYELTDDHDQFDDLFLFENSLGGLDTIRFTGKLNEKDLHDLNTALFGLEKLEYYLEFNRVMSKNTGLFLTQAESAWAREFFASTNRWWWNNGKWKRITVLSWEVERIYNEMSSFGFDFALSLQEPLRKVERGELTDPDPPAAYDYNEDYNNDYLIKQ